MNKTKLFSDEELEEINGFYELTQEMKIDGKDIVCFEQLLEILQGKIQLSELTEFQFRDMCEQFFKMCDIFLSIDLFDGVLLEKIKIKFENVVSVIENKQFEAKNKEL